MPCRAILLLPLSAVLLALVAPLPVSAQQRPATITAPSGPGGADPAQFRAPPLDPLSLVMAYHRMAGTTIDFRPYAERSAVYSNANTFDRPDVLTREIARLEGQFAALDLNRTYVMRLGTQLRQYDGNRRGYALGLSPDSFVPMTDPATYKGYGLQFRNVDEVAFLPVGDSTAARNFAQRYGLNTQYDVAGDAVAELAFRLAEVPPAVGSGPTIVRADILAARVLTRNGQPMWDFGQTAAGRAPAAQAAAPGTAPTLKAADVQGIRIGMPLAEGAGIASRDYPIGRYGGSGGGRWFRELAPRNVQPGRDTAPRCGLDELPLADMLLRRDAGGSPEVPVSDASEACIGFGPAQDDGPTTREQIGRVTSGQRLAGATADTVRQALVEKYGTPTYSRNEGRVLQWIGRDPARPDGGQVSINARIDPRQEGGVLLGVEAKPYVDPSSQRAATPAAAPAAPRL